MQPIIQMRDVSFGYGAGTARALDHVTLDIAPGEFVGVIGPSGAGKSTLAHVLSAAIPHHYTGQLYGATLVDGADTCEVTLTDISRTVGSVLQDIDAQMVASVVEDELLFGMENFGVPHDQIEGRLVSALETVGIPELREREIATLSGGQKQKVAIAAILAMRPRVLVLDEPTAALDPASSRAVFETLAAVNARAGVTVVVIEQKVALLSEFCHRVLVMDSGRVAFDGEPHEVFGHAAELRALGVDSPRVARVSNSLAAAGLSRAARPCLTVDEAVALVRGIVPAGEAGAEVASASASAGAGAAPAAAPEPATAPAPVLSLDGVGFTYPGGGASVEDLVLTVAPGEVVALIGQNGAGKTTLTKLVNGLLRPARGTVTVAGLDTREHPTSAIARHVSTLFQNPDHQLCRDTVLEEVAFSLTVRGEGREAALERARAAVDRFGLPAEASPFSLSRGQRQMVALASVVVSRPRLVILDEPTSGLDYRECMTVMETVREMAEAGCAVLMVCHDMEVVSDFADRLVVMARGRVQGEGPSERIFADAALMREACVTPPQVVELAGRLSHEVSPAFAGLTEVSAVVDTCKELAHA